MHFDTGKFGAVVIVIALVLTVVIGYCTDVTKVEVNRTDYNYITDITGLFETQQIPEYIEYNPNSNYVGYDSNVRYAESNQPNNYRYEVSPGAVTTDSDRLYYNEIRPLPSVINNFTFIYLNYVGSEYSLRYQYGTNNEYNVYGFVSYGQTVNNTSVTTLYDVVVGSDLNYQNSETLEIDFSTNINYPVFVLRSFNEFVMSSGQVNQWTAVVNDNNVLDRVIIDVTTMTVHAYKGDTEIWTNSATDVPILYSYWANEYSGDTQESKVPLTLTMNATITGFPTYGYADPQGGVTFPSGPRFNSTWSNGYEIGEVTFFVGYNAEYPNTSQYINIMLDVANTRYCNVRWENGELEFNFNHAGGGDNSWHVGRWQGVVITYSYITGIATATPTGTIRDYTSMPSVMGPTYTAYEDLELENESVYDIRFRYSQDYIGVEPPRFGIYSTTVFLNSYDVVMNDPSIDIEDYWPNLEQYRLNFYSFALVGDSMTLNGVTYPLSESQTITVTDANGKEYTRTLTNIYITTDVIDGTEHTFLTFVNDGLTVDLGETTTEVVSFSGLWYFTTGLYEPVQVTGHEYKWNIDGQFHATAQQVLIVFLGLLVVGVLIGKVALKQEISYLDWLLIIGAGVIALAMSGVFFK